MKIAYAWLLLALVLSNWIGGFLIFEISHIVELRHEMNAVEQAIAQEVQQAIGTKSVVKDLEQQPRLKGDIYGDAAFATEIAGEAVHYTLIDESQTVDYTKITQTTDTPSSDEHDSKLLKSLFQEFEITAYNFSFSSALTSYTSSFYFKLYATQSYTSILIPPPNFA